MLNKFYYKNFNPDEKTLSLAQDILQRIEEASPSNSTVLGTLEFSRDGYAATVDIYSTEGTFTAVAFGPRPDMALCGVEEKISNKIAEWNRRRFKSFQGFLSRSDSRDSTQLAV